MPSSHQPSPPKHRPWRVLAAAAGVLSRVAPPLQRRMQRGLIRAGYSVISAWHGNPETVFMNFGFAPLDGGTTPLALEPSDQADSYAIALYHRVAGARDLRGRRVLEVGCGRGGGSSFIRRYLGPASVTGVDFAPSAIRFCRRRHQIDGLTFLEGDAQRLPFPDGSFDAVVNVESSHCYPGFEQFLDEVRRVLAPGGVFLFADLRPRERIADMRAALQARFRIDEEENITPNVHRALVLDSRRRSELIDTQAPRVLRTALKNFSAVEGTPAFDGFATGRLEYVRFVLAQPA